VARSRSSAEIQQASGLPSRLRLLCIVPREPSWIALLLNLDAAGCHEPRLRWCSTAAEAVAAAREEGVDCVLVGEDSPDRSGSTAALQALRTAGCHEPAVFLSNGLDDQRWIEVCRLDAEVLVASSGWDSPALVAVIERAICRVEVARQSQHLTVARDRRVSRERDEAAQLLAQQRRMIRPSSVESADERRPSELAARLPESVRDYYHQLLRTYVMMGSGGMEAEIARVADVLCTARLGPREVFELHLDRVEALVRGLGNRSTRHVMARADLLALELMMHVGEIYRSRGAA
jgi:hypothetical protein